MTPEERHLILSMAIGSRGERDIMPEEFLREFGAVDGKKLSLSLLRDALGRHDAGDVEMAIIVTAVFGVTPAHLDVLARLAPAEWHRKHEDVVTLLGDLKSPEAVDALFGATQWVPDYLAFDEARALAVKAIYALGAIPGERADQALRRLLDADDALLCRQAAKQLGRRAKSGHVA